MIGSGDDGSGPRRRAYLAVVLIVAVTTSSAGVASPGGYDGLPDAPAVGGESATAVSATAGGTEPVRVGVIGSAFDPNHGAVAGRVVERRHVGGRLEVGRSTTHDTAVAEVIAERSPSAALYLAGVGGRPTAGRYAAAVEWLLSRDVDVIVDAGSYFPRTAAGLERFEAAARSASNAGAVFVTSAGNYADRHWHGRGSDGWVSFDAGVTRNRLASADGAVGGRVTLRLYWRGDADYDLYLYRDVADGTDRVVASSTRDTGAAEAIDTRLPNGDYYVRVHGEAGDTPVDLFAAHHRLTHVSQTGGALPPATATGVVSVGAVTDGGAAASYASDGDVSAVDTVVTDATGRFRGTSAATPVVAGTVTEVVATGDGRLSPGDVERIIRETADGDRRRLDPDAALARADRIGGQSRAPVWTGERTDGVTAANETSGANGR